MGEIRIAGIESSAATTIATSLARLRPAEEQGDRVYNFTKRFNIYLFHKTLNFLFNYKFLSASDVYSVRGMAHAPAREVVDGTVVLLHVHSSIINTCRH